MQTVHTEYFDVLDRDGYVVIPDVVNSDKVDQILELLREETCKAYGISKKDLNRQLPNIMWRSQKVANLQGEGMWRMRCDESLIDLYKQLWFHHLPDSVKEEEGFSKADDIDLICSMDSFSLTSDLEEKPKTFWQANKPGWLHSDQNKNHQPPFDVNIKKDYPSIRKNDKKNINIIRSCVQGQLLLKGTEEGDQSFVCMKGSHKLWPELIKEFGDKLSDKSYFNMIDQKMYDWLISKGCVHQKVYCPKGGVILWYSCTIHSGATYSKDVSLRVDKDKKGKIARKYYPGRAVAFINYVPKYWVTEKDWAIRRKVFELGRGTNHWVYGNGISENIKPMAPRGKIMVSPNETITCHFDDDIDLRKQQNYFVYGYYE